MAPPVGKRSNNPNGRPKGSRNRVSQDYRAAVDKLFNDNWPTLKEDIKKLSPKDRVAFFEKMFSYVMPKTTNIQGKINNINNNVPLTDEEVRQYAKALEDEV
jgi:hypothetical protein